MASPRPASLARRALPALAIAGLSAGVLLELDRPSSPAEASSGQATGTTARARATTVPTAAEDEATPTTARARATTPTTARARATTTVPGGRTTPTTSAARPAATRPTTPATVPATEAPAPETPAEVSGGACDTGPVEGPVVSTRWGPVQVAAVFDAGGALCDVQVLQYPSDHRKSVSINQRALPVLTREAVASGSADIQFVTGATITSDAYARSLQAILDGRG